MGNMSLGHKYQHYNEKVGAQPCLNYIKKNRMKWFGNLVRMQPNDTVYKVFYSRISG
uniref:Uncharacterized protein n=1 Tax=Arion vulgaris TaxID=1028688 RepID=A0A0B7BCA3_9EUPU